MYKYKRHLYNYWDWSIIYIFNKYLKGIRNPRISTIIFKNKKFQFLTEKTNSLSKHPNLHSFYCIFNNVILFNSRYINYDPKSHEFKNKICISNNNNNNKYSSTIGYEMKNVVINNNNNIRGRAISGRAISGRAISGRAISGRNRSSRNRSNRNRISKKSFVIFQ